MVAYHNHTQANINFWDRAVWQSKYNGLNLDIGYYVSANGPESLMNILDKHWWSIGSLHLKDRKEGLENNRSVYIYYDVMVSAYLFVVYMKFMTKYTLSLQQSFRKLYI